MKSVKEVNEDFEVKKPKKKALIIAGIAIAFIVIAFLLIYFFIISKPERVFSDAIDKLFEIEEKEYDSIKSDTKIKISLKTQDEEIAEQFEEFEKCALKAGTQIDLKEKKEIVNLGLEYDNQSVVDAKVYYDNENLYMFFNELFDKYIKIDMDEEQKEAFKTIFETAEFEDQKEDIKEAIKIIKQELKSQIKEFGTFEKEKVKINIGDKEKKLNKSTLVLNQEDLYNIISKICLNLAENDKFLDCFKESPKDKLKEFANQIKDAKTEGKNKVKISIYTKGLFNKIVGVDFEVYSESDKQTIVFTVLKEDKNTYSYSTKIKMQGIKVDLFKGTLSIDKEKDSKDEQKGKMTFTLKMAEAIYSLEAKLEVDYSVEYNKGIDKIDVNNSISIDDLSEQDIKEIMEKLQEKPLIKNIINGDFKLDFNDSSDFDEMPYIPENKELTTSENEIKNYGYLITYSLPTEFECEKDFGYDFSKYYKQEANNSEIEANTSIIWNTEKEYKESITDSFNSYKESEGYENEKLGDVKTIKVGEKDFNYQILSYDSNFEYLKDKYQKAYVWYKLDDEHCFTVEIESTNKELSEDVIKGFLNIDIKKVEE